MLRDYEEADLEVPNLGSGVTLLPGRSVLWLPPDENQAQQWASGQGLHPLSTPANEPWSGVFIGNISNPDTVDVLSAEAILITGLRYRITPQTQQGLVVSSGRLPARLPSALGGHHQVHRVVEFTGIGAPPDGLSRSGNPDEATYLLYCIREVRGSIREILAIEDLTPIERAFFATLDDDLDQLEEHIVRGEWAAVGWFERTLRKLHHRLQGAASDAIPHVVLQVLMNHLDQALLALKAVAG